MRSRLGRSAALMAATVFLSCCAGLICSFQPTVQISTISTTASRRNNVILWCQLLGMNCKQPTDFSFSFQGFCRRGGETDIHADGWGLAFYQNKGLRQFHDDQPASQSPLADFLVSYPIQTLNMISHIRYATHGEVDLANVHPYVREWAGVQWAFAHNGHIPMFIDYLDGDNPSNSGASHYESPPTLGDPHNNQTKVYHPVGTTDSEAAFCAILNALREKYQTTLPSLPELYATIQSLCQEIVDYDPKGTIFNFLCTCGAHTQLVYSWPGRRPGSKTWNGLHYTVREPPFSSCHLCDMDYTVDFSVLTSKDDRVAVVATTPLTDDEEWIELQPGELLLLDEGLPRVSTQELLQLDRIGHGLNVTFAENTIPAKVADVRPLTEDLRRYNFQSGFYVGGGI